MKLSLDYFDRRDMSPCSTFHFRPEGALVGDASFFVTENECHLFYLSKRNDDPPRLPCCQLDHAVSTDLLHWERLPTGLFPGRPGEPDEDGIGGCAIVPCQGIYHMFYAGTNPQVTYHAQSQDLISWQKDKPLKPVIVPDSRWYISHDADVKDPYNELGWRDPYLLYDEKNQRYVMTITARLNQGPWHERGCVAWVISKDLKTWEVQPPLYAPFIGKNLEVSEIFQMDGRFYLFFCHGETNTTRYRIAERLEGPYHCPADDTLLPSRMYAPRSVTLGGNRYLVPWAADHVEGHDDYPPQWGGPGWAWGGVLGTPQKMRSLPDGRLGLFYPEIVDRLAGDELLNPNSLRDLITQRGEWAAETGGTSAVSFQGLARGMLPVRGRDFILSCAITIKRGVAAGLILRAGETGEAGYYLRLEPGMKNISLWRYPQPWVVSRPLASKYVADLYYGQAWTVKILLHRHILDAYVNDCHVVSQAVYDYKEGHFGVFAQDAEATFAALKAHVLEE